MSDLDRRIEAILLNPSSPSVDLFAIKQVFIDEGWRHINYATMSGQEFYNQFISEQAKIMLPYSSNVSTVMAADQDAAKKAAGIE